MASLTVLLTGACGVTSRSVARALRLDTAFADLRLVGTDTGENGFGFYEGLCDAYYRVPHANDNRYWASIDRVQDIENVEFALLVPEPEVLRWATQPRKDILALLPNASFASVAGSKSALYGALSNTGLVPDSRVGPTDSLIQQLAISDFPFPAWIRPHAIGASSGRSAGRVEDARSVLAWSDAHPETSSWQLVRFIKGRNFAANVLMVDGHFIAGAQYERLEYFMSSTTLSGVTGNISHGRLTYDSVVGEASIAAIRRLEEASGERANGLFGVDLMVSSEDQERAFITEINLRPTACIESFALAGFNLASQWLRATIWGEKDGPGWAEFGDSCEILRDIDGKPFVVNTLGPKPFVDVTDADALGLS